MCIKELKNMSVYTSKSELVNLKSKGFLIHPNENLFNILQVLDTCFSKHGSSPDIFENAYEFFLVSTNLKFSCSIHKNYNDD